MSPGSTLMLTDPSGFPRVSGDEPIPGLIVLEGTEFSPRERG